MKIIFLMTLFFTVACSDTHKEAETHIEHVHESYYTCAMHPQVRESKPGKCPICHMNLTKVEVSSEETQSLAVEKLWACKDDHSITSPSATICPIDGEPMVELVNPNTVEMAQVNLSNTQVKHFDAQVFKVTRMKMTKSVRLLGNVIQAQEKESNIPLRVDGRIEKVFVKSEGEFVKKGDAVVEIYSPTLISAGEEYVIARRQALKQPNNKDYQDLLRQSDERLRNWGVIDSQKEQWFKDGEVKRSITVFSQTSGIVTARNAIKGKYFKEGQSLFDLVDLSSVWVELDVYEVDAGLVKKNQNVDLRFAALPGQVFTSKLDFVSPVIDMKSRTLKVRATLENEDGDLKLGMVADGNLTVDLDNTQLTIPRSAIVDTGKRKIIWLKKSDKSFIAKSIRTGYIAGEYIQVLSGLNDGDEIVAKGSFLLDAQARLFGGQVE